MRRLLGAGILGTLLLTACQTVTTRDVEFLIAPNTVPCDSDTTQQCLLSKRLTDQPYDSVWHVRFWRIPDFNFEPGNQYRILVSETSYSAGFIGDPAPPDYRFKKIISKVPDSNIYSPGQP